MKNVQWRIRMIKLGYAVTELYPAGLPNRNKSFCIAVGDSSEMYDAYENVFNCTEVSYADHYEGTSYKLGNLKDNALTKFQNKPHSDWLDTIHETDQYPCHSCKVMPSCGGSCPKSWSEGFIPCPSFKYNLRSNLELGYLVKNTEPVQLQNKLDEFEASLNVEKFQRMEAHVPENWI